MDTERLTLSALLAGILPRWREVAVLTVLIAALALLLSFVLPPGYESQTTFVTADTESRLSNALGDLGSQSDMIGLASQLGLGTSRDPSTSPAFYMELLASRELLTRLVLSRFEDPRARTAADSGDLLAIFRIRKSDRERAVEIAIKRLKSEMKVETNPRTNFVSLTLSTPWASLSAAVANRAVELVSAFNSAQRLSRARARRIFLEGRVASAQGELHAAESALSDFYERNRLWRASPSLVVEEMSIRRQVEMASALYLSIRQEYESARIDEINNTPVITVVDTAVTSHQPMWTRRLAITLAAALLGLWLGLLWVAARVLLGQWAADHAADAQALRESARRMVHDAARALRGRRA